MQFGADKYYGLKVRLKADASMRCLYIRADTDIK